MERESNTELHVHVYTHMYVYAYKICACMYVCTLRLQLFVIFFSILRLKGIVINHLESKLITKNAKLFVKSIHVCT